MPRLSFERYIPVYILDEYAEMLYRCRKAEGTEDGWANKKTIWTRFCKRYKWCPIDAQSLNNEQTLRRFAAYRFICHNVRGGTVRGDCYAIRDWWVNLGIRCKVDSHSMPWLHGTLKGRNTFLPPGIGAEPITSSVIEQMFEKRLDKNVYDFQVLRSGYTLCHNSIRRCDEAIQKTTGGLKVENLIWVGGKDEHTPPDINDMSGSCIVVFLFSKKNQDGIPQSASLFHLCQFKMVCGLCELITLYHWRFPHSWNPKDPIFMFKDKTVLNYRKFASELKLCGLAIGFENALPHGFRSGGNLDLKNLNIKANNRMVMAGWNDPRTMLKYELKMRPHHLHKCLSVDLGLYGIVSQANGQSLNRILATRGSKIDLRKERLVKKLKLKKSKRFSRDAIKLLMNQKKDSKFDTFGKKKKRMRSLGSKRKKSFKWAK